MYRSLLPKTTTLLLGASGQVGHEIRKALATHAPQVKTICCSRSPWRGARFPQEEWLQLDPFGEDWDVHGPMDVVINAIGAIQGTKTMPLERVHGGVTDAILRHRATLGQPRILQVSALGAALHQESSFLRSKGEADARLCSVPDTLVLRPSIVCTPNTLLAQKLRTLLSLARFALGKMLVPTGFTATQVQPILGADLGAAVVNAAIYSQQMGITELVGPERIPFGEIIQVMAAAQGRKVKLVELPRDIMETFVAHFLSVWFPGVVNREQFKLLFQDNVGQVSSTETLLGRSPASTMDFWKAEAQAAEATATHLQGDALPLQWQAE